MEERGGAGGRALEKTGSGTRLALGTESVPREEVRERDGEGEEERKEVRGGRVKAESRYRARTSILRPSSGGLGAFGIGT